jgi:hypothetical protein
VSADNRVNSGDDLPTDEPEEVEAELPRWWIRNPAKGVMSATILGLATVWIGLAIKTPDPTPGATLLYIVILPIALLLPAVALSGTFIAWHAFQASHSRLRLMLAVPAAVGVILNAVAVGLFMRWVGRVFFG